MSVPGRFQFGSIVGSSRVRTKSSSIVQYCSVDEGGIPISSNDDATTTRCPHDNDEDQYQTKSDTMTAQVNGDKPLALQTPGKLHLAFGYCVQTA